MSKQLTREQFISLKNEYCKNNDIELLRIPYYEFDNIENILENRLIFI